MFFLSTLLLLSSCQYFTSNSYDKEKYGPVLSDETDPNFLKAYNIIQNRCINCHSSTIHAHWSQYKDNNAWLDSGLVNRQDADNSFFIQRIINYGGPSSNMPQGSGALPPAEYDFLKEWINNIP